MYRTTTKKEKAMRKLILENSEQVQIHAQEDLDTFVLDPKTLTEQEKEVVFDQTYFVGLSAFAQNPSPVMEADIAEHLFEEDKLYLTLNNDRVWRGEPEDERRVIAFQSTRKIDVDGEDMLYISGVCVDPAFQGRGIGSALIKEAIDEENPDIISLRTQNPVMHLAMDKATGAKSHPNGVPLPEKVRKIGKFLAKMFHTERYDEDTMVCEGVYGSSLYGVQPEVRNGRKQSEQFEEIDASKGDAFFFVSELEDE